MTAVLNAVPIPLQDPISKLKRPEYFGKGERVDPQEGHISDAWTAFFTQFGLTLEGAPSRIASVALTGQSASIGATDISAGTLSAGLYRLSAYARITTAGGAGYTLQIILDWTGDGVARSFSGAVLAGTVLANNQSNSLLIRIDGLSPVRYSTTVVAGVAPVMVYGLDVVLEEIQA